jgi:heterodisulfide reductase subunit A-like polyferredoxin
MCCTVAVKNAIKIKEMVPGAQVFILNKDIRTYGFMEDIYRQARLMGVHFVRFDDEAPPKVSEENGKLKVEVKDHVLDRTAVIRPDLLVLSAGLHPNPDNEAVAKMLDLPINNDGFLLEHHLEFAPTDFSTEGIFMCGLAQGPKNIPETICQALAAVSHAHGLLAKREVPCVATVASVDPAKCRGCGRCEEVCEYFAIKVGPVEADGTERQVSKVDESLCKGCGKCSVICCNKSITMKHYDANAILAMIDTALEERP